MARWGLGTVAGGLTALWLSIGTALAQPEKDFPTWLAEVKAEAVQKGISEATVSQALDGVQPIDRVLELDRKQPEFTLTFDEYLARVTPPARIKQGRTLLAQNKKLLHAISAQYQVPPNVVVAMWGIETDFGRLTGGFQVVPALATLAYDGRRSQYFRGELMNALTIIDKGIPAERMRGSWAGAMGQCQFMPSTYLRYARPWQGNGPADIWTNQADALASAANYLSSIGWNPHQSWGRAVKLPPHGIAPQLIGLDNKRSLKEWSKLGIRLPNGKPLPKSDIEASLIRAETGKGDDVGVGKPYLVYDNFRVIMKWNRSTFFALGAGTLADRLASK